MAGLTGERPAKRMIVRRDGFEGDMGPKAAKIGRCRDASHQDR